MLDTIRTAYIALAWWSAANSVLVYKYYPHLPLLHTLAVFTVDAVIIYFVGLSWTLVPLIVGWHLLMLIWSIGIIALLLPSCRLSFEAELQAEIDDFENDRIPF